jgi:hypothetical protein
MAARGLCRQKPYEKDGPHMDSSVLRRHASKLLPVLLAVIAGPGALKATNLLNINGALTTAALTFTCSTTAGPSAPQTIVVAPHTALLTTSVIPVTFSAPGSGVTVTPQAGSQTLTSATVGSPVLTLTFTVSLAAGCNGVTASVPFTFSATAVPDNGVTVTTTLTETTSGLSVSSSALTISCQVGGAHAGPGLPVTESVTSTASTGTPFTIAAGAPGWMLPSTPTLGTPTPTATSNFTVVAVSGCDSLTAGQSISYTLHLASTGTTAPDKLVVVTMQVVAVTGLSAVPAAPQLTTYVKGSGVPGSVNVAINGSGSPFFAINTATLPAWLTANVVNGTAPLTVVFSSTSVCDSLAPGTYTANVHIDVSGSGDLWVPFTLLISNKAPTLGVEEGTNRVITWVIGSALPTPVITAASTDTPISYSITTSGLLGPIIPATQLTGLAYSFGTSINVTFPPLVFAQALPNTNLTGTVTLTWGNPAQILVVNFTVQVQSSGAIITALSPPTLPTALPGVAPFPVSISGTGFVPSSNPLYATKVGIVTGGVIVPDGNIAVNIINPSNMSLLIAVNATDNANLPFSPTGPGGPITIGVCNPGGGVCTTPTSTAVLTIGNNPIIQAVTSSSTLTEVTPPTLPTIAPYDMISLFGANFCSSSGTGCTSSTVLYGTPGSTTETYPATLTPDSSGTLRNLVVTFYTTGSSTVLATAPLLFATNSQINALVPAAICPSGTCPATVDVGVSFGYGISGSATLLKSTSFTVNVAAVDPGIFTIGADGQGSGAILDTNWNLISASNPAGMRNSASGFTPYTFGDSDVVQVYMTGLGIPDSTGTGPGWSANCDTIAAYETALGTYLGITAPTALDGTLILQAPLTSPATVPCFLSTDAFTASVGGKPAKVIYAGWAPNEVSGLFQVNVQLPLSTGGTFQTVAGTTTPATLVAPVQLPISVSAFTIPTQAGVSIWVGPKLYVTGPATLGGRTGTVGASWPGSSNVITANDGTAPYTFAVTSGLLPSGVSLSTLSTSTVGLVGTPAAGTAGGTYNVIVTATDSTAMTGTVAFTAIVDGGLFLTNSGASPYTGTYGAANPAVTTVTATSGLPPYTYSLTTPPAGVSITALGVVQTASTVKAGSFHIVAHGVDTTSGTPLVGDAHFDIIEAASTIPTPSMTSITGGVANATVATVAAGAGQGFTGTPTFTMSAASCLSINSTTGVISADTTCVTAANPSVTVTATDSAPPTGGFAAGVGHTVSFVVVIS